MVEPEKDQYGFVAQHTQDENRWTLRNSVHTHVVG